MNALAATPQLASHQAHGHSRYSRLAQALVPREDRHQMIAELAYLRAQRRGFEPGHELEDWLAAEMEIDTGLTLGL
jgi:hypothetical protein